MDNVEQEERIKAAICDWNKPSQLASFDLNTMITLVTILVNAETTRAVLAELEDLAVVHGDGIETPIIYTQRGKMTVTERIEQLKEGVIK